MKKMTIVMMLAMMCAAYACDVAIDISTPKDLFEPGESIKYSHILSDRSFGYYITYWIEDGEGNVVKKARNTTNTNKKSFTPRKEGMLILKAELYMLCNDTESESNYSEKVVIVEADEPEDAVIDADGELNTSADDPVAGNESVDVIEELDANVDDGTAENATVNIVEELNTSADETVAEDTPIDIAEGDADGELNTSADDPVAGNESVDAAEEPDVPEYNPAEESDEAADAACEQDADTCPSGRIISELDAAVSAAEGLVDDLGSSVRAISSLIDGLDDASAESAGGSGMPGYNTTAGPDAAVYAADTAGEQDIGADRHDDETNPGNATMENVTINNASGSPDGSETTSEAYAGNGSEINSSIDMGDADDEDEEDDHDDEMADTGDAGGVCTAGIEIDTEQLIIGNKESLKYRHKITVQKNFTIEYWIEDLFGKTIKKARNTTNTNKKSFTPSIDEKDKTIILKAILRSGCGNATAEKYIIVRNQDYVYTDSSKDSKCETDDQPASSKASGKSGKAEEAPKDSPEELIKSFYSLSKKLEEGKEIKIFASIENREGIRAVLKRGNSSEVLKIEEGRMTLKHNLTEGNNTLKLQVFRNQTMLQEEELSFYVEHSADQTTQAMNTVQNSTETLKNKKETLEMTQTYESGSQKKAPIANYLMLGISVILNMVLIWRR